MNIERFVLAIGAMGNALEKASEYFRANDKTGHVMLWDIQEEKPVLTIHAPYTQAICLERSAPGLQPFTDIENWLNSLDNESMTSENIPATRAEVLRLKWDRVKKHLD